MWPQAGILLVNCAPICTLYSTTEHKSKDQWCETMCALFDVELMLPSPRILRVKWGSIVVEKLDPETGLPVQSETIKYKDAKLWPGGSQAWNWKDFGTTHRRGITYADIADLCEKGAETIVLSMGKMSWLHVPQCVVDDLQHNGVNVIVKQTAAAVKIYNLLVESGHPVAGLFHTTC